LSIGYLNVILKEYAHGGEMFATAFASKLLFNSPLTTQTFLSILVTAASVILYGSAKEPEIAPLAVRHSTSPSLEMEEEITSEVKKRQTKKG